MTIYDIEDGYIEVDYNPNLPHHSYDWSNLENINGYKYYKAEDGRISTFGIDVSKYQGEINWDLVKGSGVEFVIIRMGYRGYGNGQLVVDEMFHENISAALNAGLGVGVYIFSQAISEEEAIEEAEFVVQNIREYEITYPVVPAVAYTIPRIATVGVPAYIADESDEYEVHQIRYGNSYSLELKNDLTAEAKVIVDRDLQIVGAEIYAADAENVANMFAFIINKKITLEELDYMIYAFPSSSSVCLYKLHNIHYDL